MRITILVPAALALFAAACAVETNEHENVASDREAILGGAATTLYPEVGIIGHIPDGSMCTATLIAPNLVLTEGDCVRPGVDSGAAYAFYTGVGAAFTGSSVTQATLDGLSNLTKHAVLESVVYPGAVYTTSPYQNDIAYVRLATPIKDIVPAKLGAAPAAGSACTVVGFGISTTTSNTGLYRQMGSVKVDSVADSSINVTGGAAQFRGDGGGPLYCSGMQVGVFFWTDDFSSATSIRRQTRVDGAVGTWIQSVMAMYPVTADVADAGMDAEAGVVSDAAAPPANDAGSTFTTPPPATSSDTRTPPATGDDTPITTSHCATSAAVGHASTSEWLLALVVGLVVMAARRRSA